MARSREQRASALFGELVRVVHGISQLGARELRRHGLTPAQYQVLVFLGANSGCSQQRLCEGLGVTKGNISMLVAKVEDAGLLSRKPDGAAYTVELTAAGRARLAELRPLQLRFVADRFAALEDDDLDRLAELIATLDATP